MRQTIVRLAVVLLCSLPVSVRAQEPSFALAGEGVRSTEITRSVLETMPIVERDIAFQTSKGERRGRYRGVLLRDVLARGGLFEGADRHADLRRTLVVTGRDGYAVAFSVGELLAEFGDTPVLVALGIDGGALPADEGLRLVVEGDRRGARAVYDIVRIELR